MSVTSGFFNSLNGDRKYNAEQMSAIFNGIINDGVFASIGTAFGVLANGTNNEITVGIGRAWFNSAWIYNDSILSLTADDSEVVLNRYDAVVIEVDHSDSGRKGDVKIIKGTPASSPAYPTMTHTAYVNQYPLAYIYRAAGSTSITQANVTNRVGTSDCPYITGILQVVNIDNIVAQWQGEWDIWSSQWDLWQASWDQWFEEQKADVDNETSAWLSEMQSDFDTWFNSLQIILDGDVAANLANSIVELQDRFQTLAEERAVYEEIQDYTDDNILDSNGNPIEGRTVMGGDMGEGGSQTVEPHAYRHASSGDDPITPAMIGAAEKPKLIVITLESGNWSSKSQIVAVTGVSSNELAQKITVAPSSASRPYYVDAGVSCVAQGDNSLTFNTEDVPSGDLTVYITIEEVDSNDSE